MKRNYKIILMDGQVLPNPTPGLLLIYILRPAESPFPLFLSQDTGNVLSDLHSLFHFLNQRRIS